jgi:dihydroorotate dehydrogenase electron transfer subunit
MIKKAKKGQFSGRISSHKRTGRRFHKIALEFEGEAARVFAKTEPGQFAEIDLSGAALPPAEKIPEELKDVCRRNIILRRPFSFCDITTKGNKTIVEILYCAVGPASLRMTTLKVGNEVSVIGPLGNGFSIPKDKKTALLVSGGMGSPPLQHLANVLVKENPKINAIAFAGAKTKEDFPFNPKRFAKSKIETIITTDDGSAGLKGFVSEHLERWIEKNGQKEAEMIIYGCGPEAMLARVAEIANSHRIDCQISMERRMACGIGLCLGCAVKCRVVRQARHGVAGSEETIYKMCCTDGPVFDSKEVIFSV